MSFHQVGHQWIAGAAALCIANWLGCGTDPPADKWVTTCPAEGGIVTPSGEAPFLGQAGAPVSVVLFGDVTCPYTIRMAIALDAFVARLNETGRSDEIEVQFRHFLREGTMPLAIALEATRMQGDNTFWQMFWCLATDDVLSDASILSCAEQSGLDITRFEEDAQSDAALAAVERDVAMARDIGFKGIPGLLLCGVPYSPTPEDVLDNLEYLLY